MDFLSGYTTLLVQSHGRVDEDDIDVDGIEECVGDDGDGMDVEEDENQVDCPEKIPIHFDILIKVLFCFVLFCFKTNLNN